MGAELAHGEDDDAGRFGQGFALNLGCEVMVERGGDGEVGKGGEGRGDGFERPEPADIAKRAGWWQQEAGQRGRGRGRG
jgi:hypothetical protein